MLEDAVHAGNTDGGEQRADSRRDQADQQGDEHRHGDVASGVDREGLERHGGEEKDDRKTGQEDVQGYLVGSLLALRTIDQPDHAIEERLSGIGGDLDHDAV